MARKRKIIVAITGASGSIYAQQLLKKLTLLKDQIDTIGIIMSDNAKIVWEEELQNKDFESFAFPIYSKKDFFAPFASGSAQFDSMIVCPCSMGTLARIAHGVSDDLLTRSADVILKERRKLVLLTRETPLSLIHINNMKTVTEAGGIIMPASPSFYSNPISFEQLADTVVNRCIDIIDLDSESYRWGKD
ncbi:MAG: 4-hydroxy-3-polyprenylbenzoate decarboxylase [Flavobacteriales bacterium]|jgi:4-hydroxy-3-polyprenylbenzoate decarboxylase